MLKVNLYVCTILLAIAAGCSHTNTITNQTDPADDDLVNYTVVYYIHADSDYLHHTPEGLPVRGNREVLATAIEVAEAARSGEFFIYYQRPERRFLGLFPRNSSRLYHYRNGQLTHQVHYRHFNKKEDLFYTELILMNRLRDQSPTRAEKGINYFLYFGHEIPNQFHTSYHRTLPEIEVNTVSFANGIEKFLLSDDDRFDLVVLSTCNNGTPEMAELLIPFTDTLLASPQNLHLSHIDTDRIVQLENKPGLSSIQMGHLLAEQTYQRLDTTIQTTITLSVYDLSKIKNYIHSLTSSTLLPDKVDPTVQYHENLDCAEIRSFDSSSYGDGVDVWYKPSRFGRKSDSATHSGWGCHPDFD